jgi:hypothetical protein
MVGNEGETDGNGFRMCGKAIGPGGKAIGTIGNGIGTAGDSFGATGKIGKPAGNMAGNAGKGSVVGVKAGSRAARMNDGFGKVIFSSAQVDTPATRGLRRKYEPFETYRPLQSHDAIQGQISHLFFVELKNLMPEYYSTSAGRFARVVDGAAGCK